MTTATAPPPSAREMAKTRDQEREQLFEELVDRRVDGKTVTLAEIEGTGRSDTEFDAAVSRRSRYAANAPVAASLERLTAEVSAIESKRVELEETFHRQLAELNRTLKSKRAEVTEATKARDRMAKWAPTWLNDPIKAVGGELSRAWKIVGQRLPDTEYENSASTPTPAMRQHRQQRYDTALRAREEAQRVVDRLTPLLDGLKALRLKARPTREEALALLDRHGYVLPPKRIAKSEVSIVRGAWSQ